MNQTLKDALHEMEALPEAEQEELARELLKMAVRRRLDAKLAAAKARGGEMPHERFVSELKARYGG